MSGLTPKLELAPFPRTHGFTHSLLWLVPGIALSCVSGQFRPRWAAVVCPQQWPGPAASEEGPGALGALRTMI